MFSMPSELPLPLCLYKYEWACICTATLLEIIWLQTLTLAAEAKMADHFHPEWRPALRLLDRSWEILFLIDAPCSGDCPGTSQYVVIYLPSGWYVHSDCSHLEKHSSGLKQDVTSLLALARDSQDDPLLSSAPLTFSRSSCPSSLIHWLLHSAQCATVYCSPQ